MLKKLTMLAISVGALVAFAVPASAGANAIVTNATGGAASSLTAISQNLVSTTNGGTLDCDTVELTMTVGTNNTEKAHAVGDGRAEGTGGGVHEEGPCAVLVPQEVPVTIEAIDVTVELKKGGKGTAKYSYDFKVNHMLPCTLSGEAEVTYTTTSITITEGPLAGGPSPCPTEGKINGTFNELLDENGEPADLMG